MPCCSDYKEASHDESRSLSSGFDRKAGRTRGVDPGPAKQGEAWCGARGYDLVETSSSRGTPPPTTGARSSSE